MPKILSFTEYSFVAPDWTPDPADDRILAVTIIVPGVPIEQLPTLRRISSPAPVVDARPTATSDDIARIAATQASFAAWYEEHYRLTGDVQSGESAKACRERCATPLRTMLVRITRKP